MRKHKNNICTGGCCTILSVRLCINTKKRPNSPFSANVGNGFHIEVVVEVPSTFPLTSLIQGRVSDNVEGQELGKFDFQGVKECTITNVIRGLFVEHHHRADQGQTEPRNSEICTFV